MEIITYPPSLEDRLFDQQDHVVNQVRTESYHHAQMNDTLLLDEIGN